MDWIPCIFERNAFKIHKSSKRREHCDGQETISCLTPAEVHFKKEERRATLQRRRHLRVSSFDRTLILLLVLLFDLTIRPCHSFLNSPLLSPPMHRFFRPRNWKILWSAAASSEFDALTVLQLKELIKSSDVPKERGLLSRLKKKSDLIQYLQQMEQTKAKRKQPLRMPVLDVEENDQNSLSNHPLSSHQDRPPNSTVTSFLSPKETIFEEVYQRFPPLRQSVTEQPMEKVNEADYSIDDDDDEGEDVDIRSLYHPFLDRTRNSSSDMDIVFLGTASCTPGTTRGVSCTALRLNWKRRQLQMTSDTTTPDGSTSNTDPSKNGSPTYTQPEYSGFVGGTWLFDVGECTQLQLQRTPNIRASKITKIFLTHAHGDHSFGLPGLLCLMGESRERDAPPVEIYGPEGLRMWLRVAIRYSVSRIVPPYRVHEICHVPVAPEWDMNRRTGRFFHRGNRNMYVNNNYQSNNDRQTQQQRWTAKGLAGEDDKSWITIAPTILLKPSSIYGEIDGGRDIFPIYDHPLSSHGAPVWEIEDEDDVKVYAAPMSHGIPCLGYVVEEQSRPGRLRNEVVEPIVRRNVDALAKAGFTIPMKAMGVIKNLPVGSAFTFPDGTVVTQEDAVEPPRQGRKIVICGDTCDARAIEGLAQNADVVVHEATNTYLQGIDKDTNIEEVTNDAIVHGHSTPYMAGEFAKRVNAKRLILNHFSSRYKGDTAVDSLSIMMRIEKQAIKASGLDETNVAAAWDWMIAPVPQK